MIHKVYDIVILGVSLTLKLPPLIKASSIGWVSFLVNVYIYRREQMFYNNDVKNLDSS